MIRRVVMRREAREEFQAAMDWYEESAPGLGWEFLRAIDSAVAAVERNPEIGSPARGSIRRQLVRRFPYWVYYAVRRDELHVLACFHTARDPEQLSSRVQ
jgi:toxin ParE1/3/4